MIKLCVTSQRAILVGLEYLLTINNKFLQDFLFVTDTGHGNVLLSSDFYEGTEDNICKTAVYRTV